MPEWITKYWVEWAFGIVAAVLIGLYRKLVTRIKQNKIEGDALRDGLRSLLRRQLIEDCEDAIQQGFCPVTMKDTITDMYQSYHALGGNGTVSGLYEEVQKLPTMNLGE